MSQVVLITGCSTGIGRDLAARLAQAGYTVAATARKAETLDDLPAALKLSLDVTQPASVEQAVASTLQHFGRIDVLVNNAGYALRGAVEEIPVDGAQRLFDTNVLGVMRMVQAVAPGMRRQRAGRIINVSSIAGRVVTPGNGVYSASKYALEALSDALRFELGPFGVQVVLIEPGAIKTNFTETVTSLSEGVFDKPGSPYHKLYQNYLQFSAGMSADAPGPQVVSAAVQQAIEAPHPKARYLVAVPFSGRLVLHLGAAVWEAVVRQMFKLDQVA